MSQPRRPFDVRRAAEAHGVPVFRVSRTYRCLKCRVLVSYVLSPGERLSCLLVRADVPCNGQMVAVGSSAR